MCNVEGRYSNGGSSGGGGGGGGGGGEGCFMMDGPAQQAVWKISCT